jgi:hypothetical protein
MRVRRLSVVGVAVAAVMLQGVAYGSSQHFSDVDPSNQFYSQIQAMADAGVIAGFPDGTFRPTATVTRQAAAAFIDRAAPRVGFTYLTGGALSKAGQGPAYFHAGDVSINPGAATQGSTGFITVTAHFLVKPQSTHSCPCTLDYHFTYNGQNTPDRSQTIIAATDGDQAGGNGALSAVYPVSGNQPVSIGLEAEIEQNTDGTDDELVLSGDMEATYAPLGPDGDSTLAYESPTCSAGDGGIEDEPNDSPSTAQSTGLGCLTGTADADDQDWYDVRIARSQALSITTAATDTAGCNGDTELAVFGSGAKLTPASTLTVGACESLETATLAPGTYEIQVSSKDLAPEGYRLTLLSS